MARILLGVSGGIAAYKAVELVRLATAAGHAVRVVQTPASLQFVGRATFEGVTGAPVLVDEFEPDPARGAFPGDPAPDHDPISHLELVARCDVLVVAPASANTLAKLAHGLADNLLSSAALASTAPLVVAPAMNSHMYEHPATQANLELLRSRGARIVEPGTGRLASRGEWGVGRLAEPPEILAAVEAALAYAPRSLDGMRVLVTAGGTREPIDSVRFVGNRSSGRMGLALAEEAARRGRRRDADRGERDAAAARDRRPSRDDGRARGRGARALPRRRCPDHGRRARGLPPGRAHRRQALAGGQRATSASTSSRPPTSSPPSPPSAAPTRP